MNLYKSLQILEIS